MKRKATNPWALYLPKIGQYVWYWRNSNAPIVGLVTACASTGTYDLTLLFPNSIQREYLTKVMLWIPERDGNRPLQNYIELLPTS